MYVFLLIFTALILVEIEAKKHSAKSKSKNRLSSEIQKLRNSYSKIRAKRTTSKIQAFMSAREDRQDDDIPDPEVVYKIALASHKNKGASCPYPLSLSQSTTCDEKSCDLNDGKGGDYVYLCVAKKKISLLSDGENMMSKIHVNINNSDCGEMKEVIGSVRNEWAFSDKITFCYGYETGQRAISDITVFFRKRKEDIVPANCELEVVKDKFLCYNFADKEPKKIEYLNLNMLTQEDNLSMMGKPEVLAEIDNDNGTGKSDNTIKRGIIYTNVKTYTWNIEHKFGLKVETKVSITTPIIETGKFQLQAALDFNRSTNSGEITTETELVQTDYSCLAPPGKYYKCKAIMIRLEADIPYTILRRVYLQNGKVEEKTIKSSFRGVTSNSMTFERCCYRNCVNGKDNICPENTNAKLKGVCPKVEQILVEKADIARVEEPIKKGDEAIDTKNLDKEKIDSDLNAEVIDDLKVIEGKSTSCPYEYKLVNYSKSNVNSEDERGDFNIKSSFDSYFICMKKVKLIEAKSQPINTIVINKFNKDCGLLTSASSPIRVDGKDIIYLCYGNDPNNRQAPIDDIVLSYKEHLSKLIAANYECSDVDFSERTFCFKRNKNAPHRFEVRDFKYEFDKGIKRQVGPPKKVNEIVVDSTSASIMVKVTKRSESTYKKSWDFGSVLGVKLSGKAYGYEAEATVSGSHRRTSTEEKKDAKEITETSNIECIAVENKIIKCVSSVIEYKVSVPYSSIMYPYDYEGKIMTNYKKKITGTFEAVQSSAINMRTCCLSGCCTGDPLETANKPHCWNSEKNEALPKDTICDELDECFNDAPSTAKKDKFRRYKY